MSTMKVSSPFTSTSRLQQASIINNSKQTSKTETQHKPRGSNGKLHERKSKQRRDMEEEDGDEDAMRLGILRVTKGQTKRGHRHRSREKGCGQLEHN